MEVAVLTHLNSSATHLRMAYIVTINTTDFTVKIKAILSEYGVTPDLPEE